MATTEWRVEAATDTHARELAPHVRPAAALELARLGFTPLAAMLASLDASEAPGALYLHGELAGVFGVCPQSMEVANIWFISGTACNRHPKAFLRSSVAVLAGFSEKWRFLFCWADAEYRESLRWLEWLGFELRPPEPYGAHGALFRLCVLRR